jgi:NAD(P)-dependent dehydrogenase (short-subunit alcohol dehydrogenase family)
MAKRRLPPSAGGGTGRMAALLFASEEGTRYLSGLNPRVWLGRMGEFAQAALFLASGESSRIIGQTLAIDGGLAKDSHIRG